MVENVPAPKQFSYAIDETKCKNCILWETSTSGHVRRSAVYGRGSGSSGLWIYGEDLRAEDVKQGLPIVGDAGKLLSRLLKEVGLSEETCFITNIVRCRPPNDRASYAVEYKACMETHSKLDQPVTPPKLILLLGNLPLKVILNKTKITENRGIIFDCPMFNCKAMATFDLGKVFRDPNEYDTVKADFQKVRDFILENHTSELPKVHKEFINSRERFLAWMRILANPEIKERYGDIETTGLEFFRNEIQSLAFTTEIAGELYGIGFLTKPPMEWAMKQVWEKLIADAEAAGCNPGSLPSIPEVSFIEAEARKLIEPYWYADLNDPEIRAALQEVLKYPIDFHRGLFDVPWFWHRGFDLNFGIDTMDMHVLINENTRHGLKFLVTIHNSEGSGYQLKILEEMGDTGRHCEAAPENLIDYNIDDTYHGFILKKKFTPMLEKEGMTNFFHTLQMPLERTLTKMSYRGFTMDRGGIIDLSNKYREQIQNKEIELWDTCGKQFSYSSGSRDLPVILFKDLGLPILKRTEKSGAPSTDKETLGELAKLHKAPQLITELRWYKNMLVKYLDGDDGTPPEDRKPNLGFLCYLDDNDRLHAPFLTVGTISGRPSCPKPNILNIPKNPEIRNLFIAPPGWKLIDIDFSQAELVLLAYLANDPAFIEAVNSSDLHTATAKGLMKSEVVDDEVRRKAKSTNFLKAYGGGAKKLAERLKISEEEAKGWLLKWDIAYPRVPAYRMEQQRKWKSDNVITGLYGRKKRFPPVFDR